jgi:hypothetical protein
MIPQKNDTGVQTTFQGEKVNMEIDSDVLTHIMGVLTDLYSDPELAIIREYSTNAYDAHIQAGVSLPIKVKTPTAARPFFTVRDFGEGLDADDIRQIYSRYGVSTKRGSNDAVGMLGLGCKSALAYVNQFTLTSIKNGIKTMVSISRDNDGAGSMVILEESESDAETGTEVSIPVRGRDSIATKCQEFFRFWNKDHVLIDGEKPGDFVEPYLLNGDGKRDPNQDRKIGDLIVVKDPNGYRYGRSSACHVVMGNVAYKTDLEGLNLPSDRALVAYVDIGEVEPAPSREALKEIPQTQEALKNLAQRYQSERDSALKRELDAATSSVDAISRALKLVETLNLPPNAKWKNEDIPFRGFSLEHNSEENLFHLGRPRAHRYGEPRGARVSHLDIKAMMRATWVVNFSNKNLTTAQRDKIRAYAEAEKLENDEFIITEKPVPHHNNWLKGHVKVIEWADIKSWRDPNKKKAARSVSVSDHYNVYVKSSHNYYGANRPGFVSKPASEIQQAARVFYLVGPRLDSDRRLWNKLRAITEDMMLVRVPGPRQRKFLKLFPNAEDADTALKSAAQKWWKRLSADQQTAIVLWRGLDRRARWSGDYSWNRTNNFTSLDEAKIDDPDFKRAIKLANLYTKTLAEKSEQWIALIEPDKLPKAPSLQPLSERYPLFPTDGSRDKLSLRHIELYLNAAYQDQANESV